MTIITTQNSNSNEQNVFTNEQWASQQQRSAIRQVLKTNRVDSSRAMQASLNEFRHWAPSEVSALFANDYPALKERKLYPLGPEFRYPPPGARRWGELAAKMAVVGVADAALFATSRLYSALPAKYQDQWTAAIKESGYQGSAQDQFDEAGRAMRGLRGEMLATSTFVSAPLSLIEQAAESRQALCVNKKGEFRVLSEGYAAISHVWGETMGLEHNGEKIRQDGRGMLRRHFDRLMEPALRCGYEWLWLDLLAIPKRPADDAPDGARLTRLKTRVINTLDAVYRNAAAVIVLDSFPLLYRGADPAQAAALLVCGPWLTRIWTYQEIKLARRALLATGSAQGFVDFATIRAHLSQLAARDGPRWEQLYKTFWRLQSVHAPATDDGTTELGINLADIALSCTNRRTNNEKDYARGFFALLRLQWDPEWSSYDDGIRHVYERRPREAAMVAAMHGPRGLAAPWSWAPKFLAGLQGKVNLPDEFFCDAAVGGGGGLKGWWHEVPVSRFEKWRAWCVPGEEQQLDDQVAMLVGVRDAAGCEREVHVLLSDAERARAREVEGWVEMIATGRAVMLAASEMAVSPDCVFPTVLLALRDDADGCGGNARDVDELKAGHVVFSGVLVDAGREGLEASLGQWVLR